MKSKRNIDNFFDTLAQEGITFDDVLIVPQYADILPKDTEITSRLTANIDVSIPFVSSAMDTVTDGRMATAMAILGGIGIIHKNLDIAKQIREVELVKHHLNGLIIHPIIFHASDTLKKVRTDKAARNYSFSGFPILGDNDELVGILTASDIKFAKSANARVSKIMTTNVITGRPDTSLEEAYVIMQKHKIGKLPLVKNDKLVGLYSFTDVSTLIENAKPLFNRDSKHRLRVGAAIGPHDNERAESLVEKNVDVLVIDTAHGHSRSVIEMCKWVKKRFSEIDVVVGNIATGEAAVALRDAGADAVKVGIGPGSICTTRVIAGIGLPQVSAIYRCAKALQSSIPIIADGGVRFSGDVPKAIAAGADTVMMGSVLASTEESPGEKIIHQGRQYVVYRGMGSLAAMKAGAASRERYGQEETEEKNLIPQGIEGIVPYSGTVEKVLTQFCGGLQASMGYCGCRTIKELQYKATFIRVSDASVKESHPHSVKIIKEAPNYSLS